MWRWLKSYLIRRRFEALFVREFEHRLSELRAQHRRGAAAVKAEQRKRLHEALAAPSDVARLRQALGWDLR